MGLSEISIETTSKCHQKCIHCSSTTPIGKELTLTEIKDLLTQAKQLGAHIFTISGGDPLLRDDIKETITFARKNNFEIRLQTAGIYHEGKPITDEFLDFFAKDQGEKDKIAYSIHGLKDTHEKITQVPNSFETAMESIRKTRAKGIHAEVHTVANSLNYGEIKALSRALKSDSWHILRIVPQGNCKKDLLLNKEQFKELQETLTNTQAEIGHNIDRRHLQDRNFKIRSCNICKDKILIRPNGDFTYCAALKHIPFGNTREKSLQYLWQEHPSAKAFRKLIEEGYKKLKGKCSSCELLARCKGGCTAQRIHAYGNMRQGPDPECYKR